MLMARRRIRAIRCCRVSTGRFGSTISGRSRDGLHQRNVTIFADGEVDRSPCGSGTSARLALLDDSGDLARGATLVHDSIIGTTFTARVVDEVAELMPTPAG